MDQIQTTCEQAASYIRAFGWRRGGAPCGPDGPDGGQPLCIMQALHLVARQRGWMQKYTDANVETWADLVGRLREGARRCGMSRQLTCPRPECACDIIAWNDRQATEYEVLAVLRMVATGVVGPQSEKPVRRGSECLSVTEAKTGTSPYLAYSAVPITIPADWFGTPSTPKLLVSA